MSVRRLGSGRAVSPRLGSRYAAAVVNDKPCLYLRFDEASGSSWADSSPSNQPVTITGTPTFGVAPAGTIDGSAVTLSTATAQYGSIASGSIPAGIKGASTLSVEAWFKMTDTSIGHLIALDDVNGAAAARVFDLGVNSTFSLGSVGNVRLDTFTGATPVYAFAQGGNSLNNGQWHHVVGVFNAGAISIYADGGLVGSGTNSGTALTGGSTTALTIGTRMATGVSNSPLNGSIDEVAIYPSALSAAQVAAHYAAGWAG